MPAKVIVAFAAAVLTAGGVTGVAAIAGAHSNGTFGLGGATSRLDNGAQLPEAKITEQQAIAAAQPAASGGLNEVGLER